MNDRTKKANGEPRQRRTTLTAQQRAFAEHYGVHGDWVSAYHHAYPRSREWPSESLHGGISKLRKNPAIWELIDTIRAKGIKRQQLDFAWVLAQAERQYWKVDLRDESKEARAWLKFISRLIGFDPTRPASMPSPQAAAIVDGEYSRIEDLPDHELIRLAGGASAASPSAPSAGPQEPERFRDLLRRTPAGAAPPDAVHVPADGGGGAHEAGDGVHAAGRGEVDLLQRVRAVMGGRQAPGRCDHCGQSHDGPCPGLRS
jgi:hypothetical protein